MSDQGQGRKRSSVLSAPKGEGGRGDEGQSLPARARTLLVRAEALPERVEAPSGLVRPSLSTRRKCAGLTSP
jgi:hypothetical protein